MIDESSPMTIPPQFCCEKTSRTIKDLNRVTISGYNKAEVFTKLFERIRYHDVDKANFWAAELVCSGHTWGLLQKLIAFAGHEVNINNPRLPSRLLCRINLCKEYMSNDPLQDRNKQEIRNLISEITSVLSLSSKKPCKLPKIGEVDFEVEYLSARIISKSTSLANQILLPEDPEDLIVPVNELATHIVLLRRQTADKLSLLTRDVGALDPYYWLSWLLEWDKQMTSRKLKDVDYRCASRKNSAYDDKLSMDIVWVVWDTILRLNETFQDSSVFNQVESLYHLFTIDYARGKRIERKFLMSNAVQLLTTPSIPCPDVSIDHKKVAKAQALINLTYAAIIQEGREWEDKFRDQKVAQYVIAEAEPTKAYHEEFKKEEIIESDTSLLTPEEFNDISDEIDSGGLVPAVDSRPHQDQPHSTMSAFQQRQQDYEPVRYDRSHAPPSPSANNLITFCEPSSGFKSEQPASILKEPQHVNLPSRRRQTVPRRQQQTVKTQAIKRQPSVITKQIPVEDKGGIDKYIPRCPDGSISLPLNCTKGVGCLYMSPDDITKHNHFPSPRQDIESEMPDFVEIVICPEANQRDKEDNAPTLTRKIIEKI